MAQAPTPSPSASPSKRFNSVAVDLLGRFMRPDRTEYPCRIATMSPGDISVLSPVATAREETIILYVDHIGRLEGTVSRVDDGGFALTLKNSERKREKLAAQLTWIANRHELSLPEDRRHERAAPDNPGVSMTLDDGRKYEVRLIDLSLSGAAVSTRIRPAVGSQVQIGTTRGRIVRHIDDGFAIEFANPRNEQITVADL